MPEFEELLQAELPALERFVKFRIGSPRDAEDVLQEICLAAWQNVDSLREESSFKPWLLGIARNKCRDYFREFPDKVDPIGFDRYLSAAIKETAKNHMQVFNMDRI